MAQLLVQGEALTGAKSIERYRAVLLNERSRVAANDKALWICASLHRVERVRSTLMVDPSIEAGAALLSPGVTTFAALAESLLIKADCRIRPLSSLARRWVLGELARSLLTQKKLSYYEPIAASTGFALQLESLITDLKRRDIWPEQFGEQAKSQQQRELALLYNRYQAYLIQNELYDAEGRFWAARECLTNDANLCAQLSLVYVDGFTDFSAAQVDILKLLAERSEEMHVQLPLEVPANDQARRAELFSKTEGTRRILQKAIGTPEPPPVSREATGHWPARDHLASQLFRKYGETAPPPPEVVQSLENLDIVAASSQQQEIEAIATRIKRQLTQGVAPEEIVVCFRSLPERADRIRSVFADYSIPIRIDSPRALSTSPVVRRLTLLLRIATQDWSYRDLLRLVGDDAFQLEANQQQQGFPTRDFPTLRCSIERLIRSAQLPRGKKELLDQLAVWSKAETQSTEEVSERDPTGSMLQQVTDCLQQLAENLAALPNQATPLEWIAASETLLSSLDVLPTEDDPHRSDWENLNEGLYDIAQCFSRLKDTEAWTAHEFLANVEYLSRNTGRRDSQSPPRAVMVTSAENVRHLKPNHLYLAGMGERAFPAQGRTDQLLSDVELERLAQPLAAGSSVTGPQNNSLDKHLADEMLLFYQIVTRPTHSLTISYPALDDKAQPLEPSPYLADVRRAFGEAEIPTTVLPLDESSVTSSTQSKPASQTQRRRHAVAALLEGDTKPFVQLQTNTAHAIHSALELIESRSQRETFGPWEGIFTSQRSQQLFTRSFGPQHFWSPSQLERYAECGFRFSCEQVLKLEPLPELTLETDVRRRGSLLHEALAAVHEQLLDASDEAAKTEIVERFLNMLETLSATQGVYGLVAALKEIQRRELAIWGENLADQTDHYQRMWHDFEEPPRPAHFEVRFGPGSRDAEGAESPLSTNEPFALEVVMPNGETETVLFTGQIDRLDIGRIDATTVFNVIDYKSSANQTVKREKLEAGTQLQLPLYALAAEQLLMRDQQGLAWEAGYWRVQGNGFGKAYKKGTHDTQLKLRESIDGQPTVTAEWESAKAILIERIGQLITGIRHAEFPVYNENENCTEFCELRTICRIGQVRSLEKKWPPESPAADQPISDQQVSDQQAEPEL